MDTKQPPHSATMSPLMAMTPGSSNGYYDRPPPPQFPRPKQTVSPFLRPWFVSSLIVVMVAMAIATEMLLYASNKQNGWRLGGLSEFGGVNYLKSFIPVIFTVPISTLWISIDTALAKMQPFILMSQGYQTAQYSIMLDYTAGRLYAILNSLRSRHWLIFWSSVICLGNLSLGSLASGVLTTKNVLVTTPNIVVNSQSVVGLNPDFSTLEYFFAASGYAAAAAINNLADPPFIFAGSWAIATFQMPHPSSIPGVNQTVIVPTVGIESITGCELADTVAINSDDTVLGVTASWDGCTITANATDKNTDQYGVLSLNDCNRHQEPAQFKPVLFWFYSYQSNNASVIFCKPTLQVWNVDAEADITTGLLVNVHLKDQNVPPSNVTGAPMNGSAFTGVSFDTTGFDSYTQARALSTQAGLPFSMFEMAENGIGYSQTVNSEFGFLNVTTSVYNRFLALSAKDTYFVKSPSTINSQIESVETRLCVYPLDAHLFTGVLLLLAIVGALVHYAHWRARSSVFIAGDTSSIAGTLSMTSMSKWPMLLNSGMDDDELDNAVRGMSFRISQRTWQIVARGEEEGPTGTPPGVEAPPLPYGMPSPQMFVRDEKYA